MGHSNMPHAEAKVQMLDAKLDTWRDSVDVDPINLPVTVDGLADVFDANLIGLMDAMCAWESMDSGANYRLVWSRDELAVRGVCPVCDDVFPVSEGFPGDELNEGYNAVCCGCDPSENFNG